MTDTDRQTVRQREMAIVMKMVTDQVTENLKQFEEKHQNWYQF